MVALWRNVRAEDERKREMNTNEGGREETREWRKRGSRQRDLKEFYKKRESGLLSGAAVSETCQRIRDLDSLLLPRSLSLMNVSLRLQQ